MEVYTKQSTKSAIEELVKESHETAKSKGWWEQDRTFGDQIALMHSELSEALEVFREQGYHAFGMIDCGSGKPEGIAAEFADVLIRIFDTCGKYEIPLGEALVAKMEYNKSRPHRHGGKKL